MNKIKLQVKGEGVSGRAFAGTANTEWFRRIGCDEIVIDVEGNDELIMLDWGLPYYRYNDPESDKKFNEYITERSKQGWQFCASWGYGMFKKTK